MQKKKEKRIKMPLENKRKNNKLYQTNNDCMGQRTAQTNDTKSEKRK